MKTFVGMGDYCTDSNGFLFKVVCRGKEFKTGKVLIGYTPVKKGGFVGDLIFMKEDDFIKNIMNK